MRLPITTVPSMTSPTPVITLMQNKGGVGKTTLALTLAASAAARGLRVLIIDADQQANATYLLDPDNNSEGDFTIYDLVADGGVGVAAHAALPSAWNLMPSIQTAGGVVDLVAGDSQMNDSHVAKFSLTALAATVSDLPNYDLVFIDCPPSTGLVVQAALAASDYALIISQPQHLSVRGIQQSLTLIEQFNAAAPANMWTPVDMAGIIINQFVPEQVEHKESLAEIDEAFPSLVWSPPISQRAVVQRAMGAHYPVIEISHPKAAEITQQANELLTRLLDLVSSHSQVEEPQAVHA